MLSSVNYDNSSSRSDISSSNNNTACSNDDEAKNSSSIEVYDDDNDDDDDDDDPSESLSLLRVETTHIVAHDSNHSNKHNKRNHKSYNSINVADIDHNSATEYRDDTDSAKLKNHMLSRWNDDDKLPELSNARKLLIGIVSAVTIALVIIIVSVRQYEVSNDIDDDYSSTLSQYLGQSSSLFSDSFTFTLQREDYTYLPHFPVNASRVLRYKFLDNFGGIIEPHVSNQLAIISNSRNSSVDCHYKYELYNKTTSEFIHAGFYYPSVDSASDSFSLTCSPYDTVTVIAAQYNKKGTVQSLSAIDVVCMYVRRELRSLIDDDLSNALDVMHDMNKYDQEAGVKVFGDDYKSADYFVESHNFNAAQKDADHIHEGLGFLTQHVKITNFFEESMQLIDPSVTLFYWDFTIEGQNDQTVFTSPYFTADTFGSLSAPSDPDSGWRYDSDNLENARIQDGRWENLTSEISVLYPSLQNGYGYMRAPWNMNHNKYVSRFASTTINLPGCLDYKNWFEVLEFDDFITLSAYAPHSSTHGIIGGQYGCDMLEVLSDTGYLDGTKLMLACQKIGFWIKEMYRGDYVTFPTDCDLNTLNCKFQCNANRSDEFVTFLESTLSLAKYFPSDVDDSVYDVWQDFFCNGNASKIFVGDHLESASPADPSFWPIHPNLERLLQARYMTGGFPNFTWPVIDSERDYVCNHRTCYEVDGDDKDTYDDCCYGHYEYDQLLDFTTEDKSNYIGPTNREVLDSTDAGSDSYSMPYIYDDFSWSHCAIDFEAIARELMDELAE